MTLGPDGCVYIVDWYNKIISHNEVPRNHPDRDKKRGRIWRLKGKASQDFPGAGLHALTETDLVAKLGGASLTQATSPGRAWRTADPGAGNHRHPEGQTHHTTRGPRVSGRGPHPGTLGPGECRSDAVEELVGPLLNSPNRNVRAREDSFSGSYRRAGARPDSDPEVRAACLKIMGETAGRDSR